MPPSDNPDRPHGAARWVFAALALPLTAYVIQALLWTSVEPFAWFLFYPVVFLAPWLAGFSSGITATLVSTAIMVGEFFSSSQNKLDGDAVLSLIAFLVMGAAFSAFHVRLRTAERAAARGLRDLRESEQRKDELLSAIPDPVVVVDAAGVITYANSAAARAFGYAEHELEGRSHDLVIPDAVHEAHRANVSGLFSRPVARVMGGTDGELFGRRKDGSRFPIEVSLNPVTTTAGPMVSTVVRDISERRRLEAAARLEADRLAAAIEAIPDLFYLFDRDDKLVGFNAAYRQFWGTTGLPITFGLSRSELVERTANLFAFDSDAERAQFLAERRAAFASGTETYDGRTAGGRTYRFTRRAMPDGGDVTIAFDLTDDLRRERELELARADAVAANLAKTEFLASMSHELRTPLNAVLGFAQLLERDRAAPLAERQREHVRHILSSGEHLLGLIDEVLDLSRIERQGIAIDREPVSIDAVLDQVADILGPVAATAGIALRVEPCPGVAVLADRRRCAQMLLNLGSNAIKYNRPDGAVTFSVAVKPERIRVMVTDTGLGIPPAQRDKLFQPFFRAGQEAGPIAGTGIGLALTKRMAEAMGGTVGYRSLESGSEFWLELPACATRPSGRAPSATGDVSAPPVEAPAGVVLYVEDNPANVELVRAALATHARLELLTAGTAERGLELVRARRPDLILMDLNLPGMSGSDALHQLRGSPTTAAIPVIAVSAAASAAARDQGVRAGFQGYLTKPLRLDDLEAVLTRYLPAPAVRTPGAILVVEDDANSREALRMLLADEGYLVIAAARPSEAIAAAAKGPIALLLTDLRLPEMGGDELASRLRDRQPGLEVVYLSGMLEPPSLMRGSFLRKPIDFATLLDLVVRTVGPPPS